jgi:hypothetical protein
MPGVFVGPDSIYTPVQFAPIHILLDHRTQPTQTFSIAGGTADLKRGGTMLGQVKMVVQGLPQVEAHQRYLLVFAPGTTPQESYPSAHNLKRLLVEEAWPITAQNQVVLWPGSTEPGGSPTLERTEPLAQIEQQLANCQA